MATLTTYAVIQGVDRLTGPLRGMASQVRAMNNGLMTAGRNVNRVGRDFTMGFTLPAALGLAAVLREAKEFSKFELGVSIAQIDDKALAAADGFEKIKQNTKKIRADVLDIAKQIGVSPTRLMAGAEAVVKMGIDSNVSAQYSKFSARLSMADPNFAIEDAAEFLGVMGKIWKFPADATAHANRLEVTANRIALAANKSRLSVGSLQEGVRQFAPLSAALGVSEQDSYSLLAGGVNAGFGATEVGTALKSTLIRFTKPNRDAYSIYDQLKINRGDFIDFSAAAPEKVMSILGSQNPGVFSPKERQKLLKTLRQGSAGGLMNDPGFTDKMLGQLYKAAGASNEEDRDRLTEGYLQAVNQGGGNVNIVGLFAKLKEKGVSLPQLSTMFEGRHAARLMAMIEHIDDIKELSKVLAEAGPLTLEKINELYNDSLYGQLEQTAAAWERLTITMADTGVFRTVTEIFHDLSEALASMDPATVALLTKGILGLAAVGPALWVAGSGLRLIGGTIGLLGTRFGVARLAQNAAAMGDMALATRLAAGSFSLLRASLVGAAITGAAWFAYENWDTLVAGAAAFTAELNKGLGSPETQAQWAEFTKNMDAAAQAFKDLTGWELPDSANTAWIDANTAAARHLANALQMALIFANGIARLMGTISGGVDTSDAYTESFGRGKAGAPSIGGGVLDTPSLNVPSTSSQPFTGSQMSDTKEPVARINMDTIKSFLTGWINVKVSGKVDGATTTTTASGALSGDAKNVKMNTGVSMPDVKPNGF